MTFQSTCNPESREHEKQLNAFFGIPCGYTQYLHFQVSLSVVILQIILWRWVTWALSAA